VVMIYNYICNQCLSTLNLWVAITLTARYTRVLDTTLCDKVCQWYVVFSWYWVGMFFTCGKYLHDRIYFHLKGRFGHTQLAYSRTRCIEVPVLSQESKRLCICVKGIEFASLYRLSIVFWKCSDNVVFVVDLWK
jgi:hypothetical protein